MGRSIVQGLGLIAGGAIVVVLTLPVAFALSRPATTLATRLRVT